MCVQLVYSELLEFGSVNLFLCDVVVFCHKDISPFWGFDSLSISSCGFFASLSHLQEAEGG